jgi:hypothetical protein
MNTKTLLCIVLSSAVLSIAARAAPISMNESALARGFALPALGELSIPETGQYSRQFDMDLINEFFLGENAAEQMEVDGETVRLAWHFLYGMAPGWNVGVTLPYYIVGGGFLDSSIEGWHRAFGLPNANREARPHNQINYNYTRDGTTLLDMHNSGQGIGDVRVESGHALREGLALRAQLKLPTGRTNLLLGNKAWGGALWLDYALPFDIASRFEGYASAGLDYTGKGDVLPELQRNFVPFGGVGLSCRLFSQLSAEMQWAVHGPLYKDSEMPPLKRFGAPLSFGVNYKFSPQTELDVLVQEDTSVYGSPDFVLHFAVAMH